MTIIYLLFNITMARAKQNYPVKYGSNFLWVCPNNDLHWIEICDPSSIRRDSTCHNTLGPLSEETTLPTSTCSHSPQNIAWNPLEQHCPAADCSPFLHMAIPQFSWSYRKDGVEGESTGLPWEHAVVFSAMTVLVISPWDEKGSGILLPLPLRSPAEC